MVIPTLVRAPRIVLPQILFRDELEISLGDRSVRLLHVGGHCADQTVAYVPGERVLFASDDVFNGKPPYVGDGDLATWITALRSLRDLPVDMVIPGHGPIGGRELLEEQQLVLERLQASRLRGGV
jgi:cyclase